MHLEYLIKFQGSHGPILLVVADGVGLAESGPANALSLANTPTIDRLLAGRHSTRLHAHGTWVGLPTDADMGNSEVGHNALGSGRIFDQGAKLVDQALTSGACFSSDNWKDIETRGKSGATIHFIGLLSDGNVHSHVNHLYAMLEQCRASEIKSVCIHALLDGRDVNPRSAIHYLSTLQAKLDQINNTGNYNFRIASGGGRMSITMDRYEADWNMVQRGFDLHVHGQAGASGQNVTSAIDEVKRQYLANKDLTDQYLAPFVIVDNSGPVGKMNEGDVVLLFNFRGDRAMEICQALESPAFDKFDRGEFPGIHFYGMLQYDGDLKIPQNYLVSPPVIEETMMEYLCAEKLVTFAVSETQKFGHVTYFWNGNKSGYIDESLETYIEIPSDNLEFDLAPHMKAKEITDATIKLLETEKYSFGRINFPNGDMVGHTGNIKATVKSLEFLDLCIKRLLDCVQDKKGILIFTSDHGNAEEMFVKNGDTVIERTSHSLNPVPFTITDAHTENDYELNTNIEGSLANVAATVFNLLGFKAPDDYEPSLITIAGEPLRRTVFRGRVINLGLEFMIPPNNELMTVEMVRHPGGTVILALDDNEDICLIRQFRHSVNGWIWELPAGTLERGELPAETARRELQEETGCTAQHWNLIGSMYTTPGFCDEVLFVYSAAGINKGIATPEEYEFIEIHWVSVAEIKQMIGKGEIKDAKTITSIFMYLNQYKEN